MKNRKQTAVQPRNSYTAEDKAKARKYYLMGLNLQEISKLMDGCPVRTLEKWQAVEQWTKLKQLENIEVKAYELQRAGRSYKHISGILGISTVTVWRYIRKVEDERKRKYDNQKRITQRGI